MNKRELEEKIKEQKRLGYPNFKNRIVKVLVDEFGCEEERAKKTVYGKEIEKRIDSDMVWAQHMGTQFWAEEIMKHNLLYKEEK